MKNKIIPHQFLYTADHSWLTSHHIFSFAEYYDPQNMNFGNLRVFNDDIIAPKTGFGLHPHANAEIVTIVLSGAITHGDTMGNTEEIQSGEIQVMTAGRGIEHSEENKGDEAVHLYQIWCKTRQTGLEPRYQNHKFPLKSNTCTLLVSGDSADGVGYIHADVRIFRGLFESGTTHTFEVFPGKGVFLYVTTGKLQIGKDILGGEDQLRYGVPGVYTLQTLEIADFVMIEVSLV